MTRCGRRCGGYWSAGERGRDGRRLAWRDSPTLFLFVKVFVAMIGHGIVVPLLPLYARKGTTGALLVGLPGSLYAAIEFVGGLSLSGTCPPTATDGAQFS